MSEEDWREARGEGVQTEVKAVEHKVRMRS